jgi:DnaJ-class molecular chaperone
MSNSNDEKECYMCWGTGIYQDHNQTYTEECPFCKGKGILLPPSPPGLANRPKVDKDRLA